MSKFNNFMQRIDNQMLNSSKTFEKFLNLNSCYAGLNREIQDYNQIISRYLDTAIISIVLMPSYFAYVLVYQNLNPKMSNFFVNVLISDVSTLLLVIGSCASVSRSNNRISRITLKFYGISNQHNWLMTTQYVQVNQINRKKIIDFFQSIFLHRSIQSIRI